MLVGISHYLLFTFRTCDRGLPLQASDCGAQSAAFTLAPPEHLYPQGIHSLPERQLIFCHHQTVPSPLCPDGAQPDWDLCLTVCHCPRPLKWYFEDRNLKVKDSYQWSTNFKTKLSIVSCNLTSITIFIKATKIGMNLYWNTEFSVLLPIL